MFKVVVSDLDGTLLNSQHQVSTRTHDTLHRLLNKGIKFVIATGRHHVDVKGIRDTLGMDIFLITSNGAVVHDKEDKLIFNQPLPAHIASELLAIKRDSAVHINVFSGDEWLVEEESEELLKFHTESGFSYRLVDDVAQAAVDQINKVFYIAEHTKLVEIETYLKQRFGDQLSSAFSLDHCLEVMHAEVNKGHALQAILEQNGYTLSDAIAFGDGMNDFEMLSMVGRGVVMANANNRLNQALPDSDRTLSSDEDGVAVYLEKLFTLNSNSAGE